MREILFRGRMLNIDEWAYGFYGSHSGRESFIIKSPYIDTQNEIAAIDIVEVSSETVGQYTGVNDKTGNKIFDGDIVSLDEHDGHFLVEWFSIKGKWHLSGKVCAYELDECGFPERCAEIIGNIHDNPELLEA